MQHPRITLSYVIRVYMRAGYSPHETARITGIPYDRVISQYRRECSPREWLQFSK